MAKFSGAMLQVLMPTMLERLGMDNRLIDLGCSWAQKALHWRIKAHAFRSVSCQSEL